MQKFVSYLHISNLSPEYILLVIKDQTHYLFFSMVASKYVTPSPMGGIDVHLPLPQDTTPVFASLPEWIVDDIADFLLFALQYFPLGTYTS